jgi:hypothetical protein
MKKWPYKEGLPLLRGQISTNLLSKSILNLASSKGWPLARVALSEEDYCNRGHFVIIEGVALSEGKYCTCIFHSLLNTHFLTHENRQKNYQEKSNWWRKAFNLRNIIFFSSKTFFPFPKKLPVVKSLKNHVEL